MKKKLKPILVFIFVLILSMSLYGQGADSISQIKKKIENQGLGISASFKYVARKTIAYEVKYTFKAPIFEWYNSFGSTVATPLINWLETIKPTIAIGYQDIRNDLVIISDSLVKPFSAYGVYVSIGMRKSILENILAYSVLMQLMYVTPDNDNYDNDLIYSVGGYIDFWLSKKSYFSIGYLFDSRDLYGGETFYPLKLKSSFRWVYFF